MPSQKKKIIKIKDPLLQFPEPIESLINKGLTFRLDEEGELQVDHGPVYGKNEPLYLVIYNLWVRTLAYI